MSATIFLLLRILIASSLFAFVGWVIWIMYADLKLHSQNIAKRMPTAIVFTTVSDRGQQVFQFREPEFILGRDPSCKFHFPDSTLSAKHARFTFHHRQWWVEDLKSTNGTYIRNDPVTTGIVLTNGDSLRCGSVSFMISFESSDHDRS